MRTRVGSEDTAESRANRERHRWRSEDTALWAGAGVVIGGFVLAYLVPDLDHRGEGFEPLWFLTFGVATILIGALYFVRRDDPVEPGKGETSGLSCLGYLGILLLLGMVYELFPNGRFAVFAADRWSPSVSEVVQWASVVALVPFLLTLALVGRSPRGRSLWRGALSFTAGVLTLVLLTGTAGHLTLRPPVEHTLAEPGNPLAVPTEISRVGWSWTLPEDTRLREIRTGSRGPLLVVDDGVLALDGATGEELWSYRRSDVVSLDLRSVAGDEQLHVWQPTGTGPDTWELLVLDTATGEILRRGPLPSHVAEQLSASDDSWSLTTEVGDLHVSRTDRGREPEDLWTAVAHSTMSGEELWRIDSLWEPGETCHLEARGLGRETVVGKMIVIPLACSPAAGSPQEERGSDTEWTQRMIAVDIGTGDEVWRWERPAQDPTPPSVWSSLERSGTYEDPVFVVDESVVLNARTGEKVAGFAEPVDEFTGYGSPIVHTRAHGSIRVGRIDDHDHADRSVEWFGRSGELTDTFRIEDVWRGWYQDDYQRHAIALDHTTLLTPFTGGPDGGGASVLSLVANGGSVDAEWIEVDALDQDGADDTPEHRLIPLPGAILSQMEAGGDTILYGLVP